MCCPTCLPNEFSSSCQKALDEYQTDRQQMIEKYGSLPCKVDEDCVLVAESNRCHEGCLLSFPKATASFFSQNQHTLDMQCSLCPMPTIPPCVSSVALCSNGQCVLGVPR